MRGHKHTTSATVNQKAHLASAYNELGKELSSSRVRVVGSYTLGKTIGAGTYGKVRLGTHRLTSARVAIKQIPKALSAALTREIHHHRQLHHPHVAQLFEVIATEQSIWLVTELCAGGELFDYLAEKGRLAEGHARALFGQLCLAVAYIHEKGIVHRDLKLENVLLDERCRVKLGDFGFTREWDRAGFLETFCGATGYASPEILERMKYVGPQVDVWSLGVILYCLLTGGLPFDDDDDDEAIMRLKVIRAEFAYSIIWGKGTVEREYYAGLRLHQVRTLSAIGYLMYIQTLYDILLQEYMYYSPDIQRDHTANTLHNQFKRSHFLVGFGRSSAATAPLPGPSSSPSPVPPCEAHSTSKRDHVQSRTTD